MQLLIQLKVVDFVVCVVTFLHFTFLPTKITYWNGNCGCYIIQVTYNNCVHLESVHLYILNLEKYVFGIDTEFPVLQNRANEEI